MKHALKNHANHLIMLLAMALTLSCSEVDDILDGDSSSSGGASQVGGNSSSSGGSGATKQEAFSLTAGQWTEGSIAEIDGELWYEFTATANTTYYVWWNDRYSGPKTYRSDVMVMAYDSNGEELFYVEDDSYVDDVAIDEPKTITLTSNGTVYLKVVTFERYAGLGLGFGIAYNTSGTAPGGSGSDILGSCVAYEHGQQVCAEFLKNLKGHSQEDARQECVGSDGTWSAGTACPAGYNDVEEYLEEGGIVYYYSETSEQIELPANAISLTSKQDTQGSIATEGGEVWYKFSAVAGVDYYVIWSDSQTGSYDSNNSMADVIIKIYNSDGDLLFSGDDEGIQNINLSSSDTIYIRVIRISEQGSSFRILYDDCSDGCG